MLLSKVKMRLKYFSFKLKMIHATLFILAFFLIYKSILHADQGSSGFIMLSLHLSNGRLSLNSFKEVTGATKRAKRITKNKSFFYEILTGDDENILTDYFEVPVNLKYDNYTQIGDIKGGFIALNELDFIIRLPRCEDIKEVRFFKYNSNSKLEGSLPAKSQPMEDAATFLGAVSFE